MLRYRVMLVLSVFGRYAPRWMTYSFAWLAGRLAYRLNTQARAIACVHVRRALGPRASEAQVRRAVRGCFRAAAYYYADLFRTPLMDPARFARENLRTRGFEHIARAYQDGKGVIIATIHYGNPEYVSQCMSAWGYTFFALTERLEPRPLADLFQRLRSSQGQTFMTVNRGAIKAAIRHLRRGGALCIVADRDIQHSGEPVPFLGATARLPTGAVDLARHTGAVLIPAVVRRVGWDHFVLEVEPPLTLINSGRPDEDRRVNTARLIRCFEPYLQRDPSQWFVLEEPIWPNAECGARRAEWR
jgi:lauroyl/myristoyl acyltransferase